MRTHILECIRLEAGVSMSGAELADISGLTVAEIEELVDYGALAPLAGPPDGRSFGADCVPALRRAARLRSAYEIDLFSMALLLECLQQIGQLEDQVRALQARGGR
jgi:chaperone modulatory protein CbpM